MKTLKTFAKANGIKSVKFTETGYLVATGDGMTLAVPVSYDRVPEGDITMDTAWLDRFLDCPVLSVDELLKVAADCGYCADTVPSGDVVTGMELTDFEVTGLARMDASVKCKDDTRRAYRGLCLDNEGICRTDGVFLAYRRMPAWKDMDRFQAFVHEGVMKAMSGRGGVKVTVYPEHVSLVASDGARFTGRCNTSVPRWTAVVPDGQDGYVTLDADALKKAVSRAKTLLEIDIYLVVQDSAAGVWFNRDKSGVSLPCESEGCPDVKVRLGLGTVESILRWCKGKTVRLGLNGRGRILSGEDCVFMPRVAERDAECFVPERVALKREAAPKATDLQVVKMPDGRYIVLGEPGALKSRLAKVGRKVTGYILEAADVDVCWSK